MLSSPAIMSRMSDVKAAKEVAALEEFLRLISDAPDRAFFGLDHVRKALDMGAIRTLMITDELFRSKDVGARATYVQLVDDVKDAGGEAFVFSSISPSIADMSSASANLASQPNCL